MAERPSKRRVKVHPTRFGWLVIAAIGGLASAGLVTGSPILWIVAGVILSLVILLSVGVPESVRRSNTPPGSGMTNAPGDLGPHDRNR